MWRAALICNLLESFVYIIWDVNWSYISFWFLLGYVTQTQTMQPLWHSFSFASPYCLSVLMFSRENSLLTISWIWEVFHPSDELPIKTSIYYSLYKMSQCVCIISVRSKDILQKIHLNETMVFKPPGVMEPVVPLPGTELMLSISSDIWLCLALPALRAVQTLAFNLFLGIVTALSCFSLMFWTAFPPLHVRMETKGALAGLAVPKR